MELFEASDKEQWQLITETIDASDYYVLIIRWKYGSIFNEGADKGISYTEKELDYVVSTGVPVLAFIIAEDVPHTDAMREMDPDRAAALLRFISKVKTGRTVKQWHNADELASLLSQSLSKRIWRGDRPGWVRTTEFDIEKSHAEIIRLTERVHMLEALNADLKFEMNRKPVLYVEIRPGVTVDGTVHTENLTINGNSIRMQVLPINMRDANDGIIYKDAFGKDIHVEREEVRKFRYICLNAFALQFNVHNKGDARATGVRVQILFPNDLLVISEQELEEYLTPNTIFFRENAFQNWNLRFFAPSMPDGQETIAPTTAEHNADICMEKEDKFISLDELTMIGDIADLLDPAYNSESISIYPGELRLKNQQVGHKTRIPINGVYVLPTKPGKYEIICKIICDEYPGIETQIINVEVN